jgi:beta-phosphoglucomutase-like phosphatase (HAD superfamily)
MRQGTAPARTFWWDRARPVDADVIPLRAVIFNVDGALADIERDGHRVAFNAAFAECGLDVAWNVDEYGRLLRIGDERRRIASDLRSRGFGKAADELAAPIYRTKKTLFSESILECDVTPRQGLIDLVMSLFVAGVWVGVVSGDRREWVEPLVRQLVGDGLVETIVTADDVTDPTSTPDLYGLALWEFGIAAGGALAVEASAAGLRAAGAAGIATVIVPTDYTAGQDFTGAAAVRPAYDGAEPLLAAGCQRLHRRWWTAKKRGDVTATPCGSSL